MQATTITACWHLPGHAAILTMNGSRQGKRANDARLHVKLEKQRLWLASASQTRLFNIPTLRSHATTASSVKAFRPFSRHGTSAATCSIRRPQQCVQHANSFMSTSSSMHATCRRSSRCTACVRLAKVLVCALDVQCAPLPWPTAATVLDFSIAACTASLKDAVHSWHG